MSEEKGGDYTCTASLPHSRISFVQTKVRLKPEIILSVGGPVSVQEDSDVFLECVFVKGVEGKRIWQYNGDYFYEVGDRTSYENHGGLLVIKRAVPNDSGNYSCIGKIFIHLNILTKNWDT